MKAFDVAPRRKRLGFIQRELEQKLGWPAYCLSAIEDGRIGVDEETHQQMHDALDTLAREKTDQREGVAAA